MSELEQILSQLMRYSPELILLFGSQAKGTATAKSDFDLCVVAETQNKRRTLADMYYEIESERPIDFLLYTPSEWRSCVGDPGSFAYKIEREGQRLYG